VLECPNRFGLEAALADVAAQAVTICEELLPMEKCGFAGLSGEDRLFAGAVTREAFDSFVEAAGAVGELEKNPGERNAARPESRSKLGRDCMGEAITTRPGSRLGRKSNARWMKSLFGSWIAAGWLGSPMGRPRGF
jgi:hypothetical protein